MKYNLFTRKITHCKQGITLYWGADAQTSTDVSVLSTIANSGCQLANSTTAAIPEPISTYIESTIQSILTPPELLTVNTINKYLELKARRMI